MIRTLSILVALPFISACGLEELFNPGSSQRAYEARAAVITTLRPYVRHRRETPATEVPMPVHEVAEIVPEPVYVHPEPTKPSCQPVYAIYNCSDTGDVIWL